MLRLNFYGLCVLKTYNNEYRTQGEREIDRIKCESTTFFFYSIRSVVNF